MKNILLFILLLTFVFFSCQGDRDTSNRLDEVEKLMETNVDSAHALLDGIPMSDTMNDKFFARWCMLKGKIADKLHEDMPYVEQLDRASNWYAKHGTKEQQAWIGFYLGRSYAEDKLFVPATNAYSEALVIALEGHEYNVAGYICSYMGDLYLYKGQTSEERRKYKEAADYFKKAGNMRSYAFALRDIAKALTFEDSCSVALDYMLMADSIIIELQDSIGMASITNGLGNIYYRCGNFREAKKYFLESIIFDIANSAPSFSALSNVYLDDGMLDSARYYLKQAYRPTRNPYTLVGLLYENYLIEKRDGNISYALQYIEQYNNAKDSLYNKDIKVDIIDAEKRHNLSELLKKNKDLYIAKSFYIILLSLSVIIGLTIYLTYQIRDKNRIRKINDQQVDLEQKEIRLKELENEIRSKNSKLEDTRTLQQEFIKLRQDLNSLKNTKFEADIIVKKIKKLCGKVNPDKEQTLTFKDWNRLTALINSIYPNVAVFIKSNPYNLTEKEIEMCYLSFLQLDVKEESILLDINPESVSKRRLRTRQKLNLINLEKSIYEFMLIS